MITLKDAVEYVRTNKATSIILAILRSPLKIFTFKDERHNRVARYVAVINEYKKGTSLKDIEERFGCTKTTIHAYVRQANITPRSFKPLAVRDAVLRDYKLGVPLKKICELHGVKMRYIQVEARKAGLRRNKGYGQRSTS